jgi:hypothetical protein
VIAIHHWAYSSPHPVFQNASGRGGHAPRLEALLILELYHRSPLVCRPI